MLAACLLLAVAVLGGALLTFLYDRQSAFAVRLSMGAVTGIAMLTTLGFAAGSWLGLNAGIFISGSALLLPWLLLRDSQTRSAISDCLASARDSLNDTLSRPGQNIGYLLFYASMVVLLALVFGRGVYQQPDGIYTGMPNNLGDLPLHIQVISSFAHGNNLAAEDPTFAGVRFTYSLLADYLSAMLVRSGADIITAIWLPGMALALAAMGLLSQWTISMTKSRLAGLLAVALMIFSGGLGWWLLFQDLGNSDAGLTSLLAKLPHDYTIMPESIFRWGNSLTTLFIPQRSILFGVPLALSIFYLWWLALNPEIVMPSARPAKNKDAKLKRKAAAAKARPVIPAAPQENGVQSFARLARLMTAAGVLAGSLPLIHAHTFAVVMGVACCLTIFFHRLGRSWLMFFVPAFLLAAPEVLWLSHTGVAASAFVGWKPGWDHGSHNILWFWFVNTGFFVPLLLIALFRQYTFGREAGNTNTVNRPINREETWNRPQRLLLFYAPFVFCLLIPNLVKLAPWIWDNIKVLFYWYLASIPLVAGLLASWFKQNTRLKWLAGGLVATLVLGGALDILRVVSNAMEYREFDRADMDVAGLISQIASPRAVVLHAPIFNSPVFLTGRRSLLGYPGWTWSRGLDSSRREADLRTMYAGGPGAQELLMRYKVDYALIGLAERSAFPVNDQYWSAQEKLAQIGPYQLYKVGPRK
ncbi:MAG TPA: hypothetical protein VKZ53_00650 [Candidatus Angelobacter sp.]|nr:hypothetical protein [Candidatus Angelobacter sp.]